MEEVIMHIGKRILYLRRRAGLSQSDLGRGIISSTHLSNVESGRYIPSMDILESMAKRLNVPLDYLCSWKLSDEAVQLQLSELRELIITDPTSASLIIEDLSKSFISSIQQEIHFALLSASHKLKNNEEYNDQLEFINLFIDGDEQLPSQEIKKSYYYFNALKNYRCNNLKESFSNFYVLSTILDKPNLKAPILYNLALISKKLIRFDQSYSFAKQSLDIYREIHNWEKIGELYNFIGVLQIDKNDLDSATEYLSKAKEVAEMKNIQHLLARINHNLGWIYSTEGETDQAITLLVESLKVKKTNVILTYTILIECYLKKNAIDAAKELTVEAFSHCQNPTEQHLVLLQVADIKMQEGFGGEHLAIIEDAISYFTKNNDLVNLKGLHKKLGDYYFSHKKYKLAATHYQKELNFKE
jgi:HTH-type transcriptional regulator, quorum sensing regulator NprR